MTPTKARLRSLSHLKWLDKYRATRRVINLGQPSGRHSVECLRYLLNDKVGKDLNTLQVAEWH